MLHYDGQTWQAVNIPTLANSYIATINSFAFTAKGEGWATGFKIWNRDYGLTLDAGQGFTPRMTPLILHFQNGSWTIVQG